MRLKPSSRSVLKLSALALFMALVGFAVHAPILATKLGVPVPHNSDAAFNLAGAETILEMDLLKKFNLAKYPIIAQARPITEQDMPSYAKYVLAFYPNPSFKFGYSLTAGLLTAPFSDAFFGRWLNKLLFTNLLCTMGMLALIFLIFYHYTGNYLLSLLPPTLVSLDVFLVHNNYTYHSHTLGGLVLFFLAWWLYLKWPVLTPLKMGVISLVLSYSAFSSSHHVALGFFFGALIVGFELFGPSRILTKILLFFAAVLGAALPLIYILGVEHWFHFPQIGMPTFLAQIRNYDDVVKQLAAVFPVRYRFIWDLRLWNIYFIPIVFLALVTGGILWRRHSGLIALRAWFRGLQKSGKWSFIYRSRTILIPVLSFVLGFTLNACITLPVSRAMTPYLVCLTLGLGAFLVGQTQGRAGRGLLNAVRLICLGLFLHNYLLNFGFLKVHKAIPENQVFYLDEDGPASRMTAEYFRLLRKPPAEFNYISKSVQQFVSEYSKSIKSATKLPDPYIMFKGISVAGYYTPMRRFTPAFVATPECLMTTSEILSNFKLVAEILTLKEQGLLVGDDFIEEKVKIWQLDLWDQEFNYLFGYQKMVSSFLGDSILNKLDTRSIYYVRLSALEKLAATQLPQGGT